MSRQKATMLVISNVMRTIRIKKERRRRVRSSFFLKSFPRNRSSAEY